MGVGLLRLFDGVTGGSAAYNRRDRGGGGARKIYQFLKKISYWRTP